MISIILPSYNEEENIPRTMRVLSALFEREALEYELIFVNDGSKDRTEEQIKSCSQQNVHVRGINFSRNFGKEACIFAGLRHAKGDCCVVMDCDLQHPPKTIVEMYRLWEQGFEIVEGIKNTRGSESPIRKGFAKGFYKIISALTGFDMENASDFKLLSNQVVEVLLDMPERKTFFRAMSFWVGFKGCQVCYDVADRAFGKTKWSFFKLARYAVSNIVSFSTRPLSIVSYMGVVSLFAGLILAVQTVVRWASGKALEGFPTVILLLLLLGGGILLGLGIIGSYIAAIYQEVKGRPRYVVRLDTEKLLKQGSTDD